MDRDVWSNLAVFAAIADAGSFASAAVRLALSASALSHAMRTLEAKLGVRLLDRTTRSLAPTQAGAALLLQLRPAMNTVDDALCKLAEGRQRPAGLIRVNAHRSAALHVVLPRLVSFAADYPDVVVELVVQDGLVDIVAKRFDCGVRHEGELQRDMISVRISGPVPLSFVAAPAYLARASQAGGAARPRGVSLPVLPLHVVGRAPSLDVRARRQAASAGGPGHLHLKRRRRHAGRGRRWAWRRMPACFASAAAGGQRDAVEVLLGWAPTLPPNHLYFPSRRQPSAATRAFVNAMLS